MPVKASYRKPKKKSVVDGLREMREREEAEAAAKAKLPKFRKFDPQYAEESLVPELRMTRPPKESEDSAPAWVTQAMNTRKKRRKGSGGPKLAKLETEGSRRFSQTAQSTPVDPVRHGSEASLPRQFPVSHR